MKVGLTVELRCPQGSIAFQSHIDATPESIRHCKRELAPGETWVWNVQTIDPEKIAFFGAQTMLEASMLINGTETLMEGQQSTDFGVAFARRGEETFGTLPFDGTLTTVSVTNLSEKKNRIAIIFGEL
jgi:hypothetical protein